MYKPGTTTAPFLTGAGAVTEAAAVVTLNFGKGGGFANTEAAIKQSVTITNKFIFFYCTAP